MSTIDKIDTEDQFSSFLKQNAKHLIILHFGANWAPQCKQLNDIMQEFRQKNADFTFAYIEAERLPIISMNYQVTAVPTLVFIRRNEVIKLLKGGNPRELLQAITELTKVDNATPAKVTDVIGQIKELIASDPIMLFMKGNPEAPQCGFSRKIVEILSSCDAIYKSFDILTNDNIREALKTYSNWPTYPQLYINNELVGGLDIVQELYDNGELQNMISQARKTAKSTLNDRLESLTKMDEVVLFMKGNPDQPKCGFSRNAVEILKKANVRFNHFDILTDDEVRQGLKEYSKWPTYPQLYCKGELIGGFDIIKELDSSNELASALSM